MIEKRDQYSSLISTYTGSEIYKIHSPYTETPAQVFSVTYKIVKNDFL